MAKFRIKPELVAALQAAGYMPGGLLKMRIPYKENRLTGESCYEISFGADSIVDVPNEYGAKCVLGHKAPAIKKNGAWIVADPSTSLFEEVPETGAAATLTAHVNGQRVLTKNERSVVKEYGRKNNINLPKNIDHTTMLPYLTAAKGH